MPLCLHGCPLCMCMCMALVRGCPACETELTGSAASAIVSMQADDLMPPVKALFQPCQPMYVQHMGAHEGQHVQYLSNTALPLSDDHIACRYEGASCDVDINECVRGTANCPANAGCVNTDGGFDCPCYFGYAASGSVLGGLQSQRYAWQCIALSLPAPPAPAGPRQHYGYL